MKLKIADDLSLPVDVVTQTILIVGKRGSGKSNTAARFVEQLHAVRIPFVVLDPVDTWWGLKASSDGGRGLDVYVFGGSHQDLPLESGAGALLAGVLCEHRMPMVLSVKHLSGRERSTFMTDFAKTLFQKWTGGPLHVVLEEAHELAPQSAMTAKEGEQAMLGAFKRLWKLGRSSGIGGTAVTQRPASLSKDITTQSEILIAHRTIGPQDVAAIGQWVKYHGEREDLLAELPSLPTGEAFVWAPEFPEGKPIGLHRTAILRRDTFDSASTPKVGERRVEPKELAPVDLERLRTQLSATIERQKAEDPRELRKQIADLKKQLTSKVPERQPVSAPRVETKVVERFVLKDGQLDRLEKIADKLSQTLCDVLAAIKKTSTLPAMPKLLPIAARAPRPAPVQRTAPQQSGEALAGGERKILTALAQYPDGRTKTQVAILTAYAHTGGGFNNYLSALRSKGFLAGSGERLQITDDGMAALGEFDPLPTGADLLAHWLRQLGKAERLILQALAEVHPHGRTKEDLGAMTGYEPNGGGFNNALSRLRSLELIGGRGELKASDDLFD